MDPISIAVLGGLGLQGAGVLTNLFGQYQAREDAKKQQKQDRKDWLLNMILSNGRAGSPPQSQVPAMNFGAPLQDMGQLALQYANTQNALNERKEDRQWREEDRVYRRNREASDDEMKREYQLWRMQQGGRRGGGSGGGSRSWDEDFG